jgi:hypothetical protein
MKNIACKTLITLSLVLLALVPAYAQQTSMTVTIPVAFTVERTVLPAGDYVVTHPSGKAIALRHVGGPETLVALTNYTAIPQTPQTPRLIFHRYGSRYFLAQAWMPNSDHGYEFFASAREIQLARHGGQDVVELALLAK